MYYAKNKRFIRRLFLILLFIMFLPVMLHAQEIDETGNDCSLTGGWIDSAGLPQTWKLTEDLSGNITGEAEGNFEPCMGPIGVIKVTGSHIGSDVTISTNCTLGGDSSACGFSWSIIATVNECCDSLTGIAINNCGQSLNWELNRTSGTSTSIGECAIVDTFSVNSIADSDDADPGNGSCDTGNFIFDGTNSVPECTLRASIQEADANEGDDKITFDIPMSGVPVILPQRELPFPISDDLITIDGTTQPDANKVKLDGSQAGTDSNGLQFTGMGVLAGLIVTDFNGHGILFESGGVISDVDILNNGGWGIFSEADDLNENPVAIGNGVSRVNNNSLGGIRSNQGVSTSEQIDQIEIIGNGGDGIFVFDNLVGGSGGIGVIMRNAKVVNNKGFGIRSEQSLNGIIVSGATGGLVSQVSGNGETGIFSQRDVFIGGVDVIGNGGLGIESRGEDGVSITDTKVNNNATGGILSFEGIQAAQNNTSIEVVNNGGAGIVSLGSGNRSGVGSGILLSNTKIVKNGGVGLSSKDGNVFLGGTQVSDNEGTGILIEDGNLEGTEIIVNCNRSDGINTTGDVTINNGDVCGNDVDDIVAEGTLNLSNTISDDTCATVCIDVDGDGFTADIDCDDNAPDVHPGAVELCNNIDDNCDGNIDENLNSDDFDGDGFSICDGDCNDFDASINPDAIEVCEDGIDQDCNGEDSICSPIDSGAFTVDCPDTPFMVTTGIETELTITGSGFSDEAGSISDIQVKRKGRSAVVSFTIKSNSEISAFVTSSIKSRLPRLQTLILTKSNGAKAICMESVMVVNP